MRPQTRMTASVSRAARVSVLATALLASLAPAGPAAPNPGFENGTVVPDAWTAWSSGPDEDSGGGRPTEADFIWDQTIAHGGARSAYIRNDGPRWASWRSHPIEVRGDTTYRLSVWVRKTGGPSSTYLRVRSGRWSAYEVVSPGREWARFSVEFKTPPGLDRLTLDLSDLGGNGSETWFDDLDLAECPAP